MKGMPAFRPLRNAEVVEDEYEYVRKIMAAGTRGLRE